VEQVFLLIAVYFLSPGKNELFLVTKSIVWSAVGVFFIGISESFTSQRIIADSLYTVDREIINDYYLRFGLVRATATLGLANYFGNACVLIFPLILYLYNKLHQKRYLVAITVTIFAIIHSGCRSDMLFLLVITLFYFIHIYSSKERLKAFTKNSACIISSSIIIIIFLSIISPAMAYYYKGMARLISNELVQRDEKYESLEVNENIGTGSGTRIMQFSGLYYVAFINPITGLGAGAEVRGDIKYYANDNWGAAEGWNTYYSYDVGIVETFCNEGILGLTGLIMLLLFLFIDSKRSGVFAYRLLLPTYILCTLSTSNMFAYIFVYMILFSPNMPTCQA